VTGHASSAGFFLHFFFWEHRRPILTQEKPCISSHHSVGSSRGFLVEGLKIAAEAN